MDKPFQLFSFLLLIGALCFFPLNSVQADSGKDSDQKDIDIELSPKGTLFNISNMKPGDWASRNLTVKNVGGKDFNYNMQIKNDGDKKLYNELLLEIRADGKKLYQGKLSALKTLPARKLASGSEENLDITIRFPEHLGNNFQGLETVFTINFPVEGNHSIPVNATTQGQIGSNDPNTGGFNLPVTSTNIFNLMLFGSIFAGGGLVLILIGYLRKVKFAR